MAGRSTNASGGNPSPALVTPKTVARSSVQVGDIVLVKIDEDLRRPLLVTQVYPDGTLSGTIFCEPEDYNRPAFRGWDGGRDGRITGQPTRLFPFGYGEQIREGAQLGQWIPRAAPLPTGR